MEQKEKKRECTRCGFDISHKYQNTKYCDECRKIVDKENYERNFIQCVVCEKLRPSSHTLCEINFKEQKICSGCSKRMKGKSLCESCGQMKQTSLRQNTGLKMCWNNSKQEVCSQCNQLTRVCKRDDDGSPICAWCITRKDRKICKICKRDSIIYGKTKSSEPLCRTCYEKYRWGLTEEEIAIVRQEKGE